MMLGLAGPAEAAGGYPQSVTDTAGLLGYWRLGERSGTTAADVTGRAPGSLLGGVSLGAHGGLSLDADTAVRFDGVDDEMQAGDSSLALADAGSLEGWFFWESGVALMRDSTTGSGWILAYDSGGQVAYRVRGTTFTTGLPVSQLRDGWHHVALTVQGAASAFYVDGEPVHTGTASGNAPVTLPWHVMRNGAVTGQFTRGRADEIAVYDRALNAETVRAHFLAGRDVADVTPPAVPAGVTATARFGRVELDWSDNGESDLDGYDIFRATSPAGPFARINGSRLEASTYTDSTVAAGTTYVYVVTASDVANNRSANSATVTATPPSTTDLLRQYAPELRYGTQESYFADSAAEMTDNYVSGSRTNYLVDGSGTRIAAANPANALADLSLGFLGNPVYANGQAATDSDYLDAANTSYQQDAQRMRAAGYGDRIYGRVVEFRRPHVAAVLVLLLLQPAERDRVRRARGRLGVRPGRTRFRRCADGRDLRPARPQRALRVEPGAADLRGCADRLRRARLARVVLRLGRRLARLAPRRLPPRRRLPRAPAARGRHAIDAVHGVAGTLGRLVVEPDRASPAGQVGRPGGRRVECGRLHGVERRGGRDAPATAIVRAGAADARAPARRRGRRRLPLPCRAAAARHPPGQRRAGRRAGCRDGPARSDPRPHGHGSSRGGSRSGRSRRGAGERVLATRYAQRRQARPRLLSVRHLLAAALFAAAAFATWLAWIAYEVLCEEGCAGRPWPLVAQLIVACAGLPLAAVAALAIARRGVRHARRLITAAAIVYVAWGLLLIAA